MLSNINSDLTFIQSIIIDYNIWFFEYDAQTRHQSNEVDQMKQNEEIT